MANELSIYAGAGVSKPFLFGGNGEVYQYAYNETGAKIVAGSLVVILENAKIGGTGNAPRIVAAATNTVAVRGGVVANLSDPAGVGDIPIAAWGYVLIDGPCAKMKLPNGTVINRWVSLTNGTQVATDVAVCDDAGVTNYSAKVFAVTKSAESGGFGSALLLGHKVTI